MSVTNVSLVIVTRGFVFAATVLPPLKPTQSSRYICTLRREGDLEYLVRWNHTSLRAAEDHASLLSRSVAFGTLDSDVTI
jgi:hypothetical protein